MSMPDPPRLSRLAQSLVLALAFGPLAAGAADPVLPSAPSVAHGQARISTTGYSMTVTTGRNAAIDWRSFSIGPQASVRFEQPDAASQVLNRVVGRDPSQILGQLGSNGTVWLLNPHGVLFGPNARVDVGGLVASTLNLSIADWAAGGRTLVQAEGVAPAVVRNGGQLRSASGGRILLVGGEGVINDGAITAPGGQVGLRAASTVDLADSARPDIAVRVVVPGSSAINRGALLAPGGTIDLQAAMVNQSGVVRAEGIARGPGGAVLLRASDSLVVDAGSVVSVAGAPGGRVELVGGTQLIGGRIDAGSSTAAGGSVTLAAPRIALLDTAELQADGAAGGGSLRLGLPHGDPGAGTPAAQAVHVAPGARLSADAMQRGDGGRINLWSDSATRAFGHFSARGGAEGGNGGVIETSGLGVIAAPASMDTRAPRGKAGLWLLDPPDVRIVAGDLNDAVTRGPDFTATAPAATVGVASIIAALASSDVTVSTGSVGPGGGTISMKDVTLNAPLVRSGTGTGTGTGTAVPFEGTLTLSAASSIELTGANILSFAGRLNLRLFAGEGTTDAITLTNSRIDVQGDVTMRGARYSSSQSEVTARRLDLQASRVRLGTPRNSEDGPLPHLQTGDTGNSLVVRGLVDNVDVFSNTGGSGALSASEGRWLLYARDPASTSLGGLDYVFKQYGATYPTPPALDTGTDTGNGLLYAFRPVLGVSAAGLPLDKVYDGSRALALSPAQLDSISFTGALAGDVVTVSPGALAGLSYDSARAARAVPITATLSGALPPIFDGERPVLGYAFSGMGLTGDIAPSPVRVAGATVADKVYDGGTAATPLAWSLAGVVPGDTVSVAAGAANFLTALAGVDKPVVARATALAGLDATNYRIAGDGFIASADIRPATLTYRAQPLTVIAGAGLPTLRGTVAGFVSGESEDTATTGALVYSTSVGAATPPGAYAVLGGGLSAINYTLVQDPANATALRVLPAGVDSRLTDPLRELTLPSWPEPVRVGRMTVVAPLPAAGFPPLDMRRLSAFEARTEIRSREFAMARSFRLAKAMLDAEPALASLPDCADLTGAMRGDCVVTPVLKEEMVRLWRRPESWLGKTIAFNGDEAFEYFHWRGDASAAARSRDGLILPGDATLLSRADVPDLTMLAPVTPQMLGSPPGGGPARTIGDAPGAAATPLPGIAAARATPAQASAEAPAPTSPVTATSVSPCVTPKQRLSGECRREAELGALREAAQRCASAPRDQQPSCLFSERVKLLLQQRERESRLLSIALETREARRAVLPDIRRKWAMVIGVEHYPKVELNGQSVRIPSAGHDARAVANELRSAYGYVTSELVNPSRADVVQRLNMLAAVAQPHDSLLVFFSGYGFTIAQGGDAIWALSDADPQDGRTVLAHADLVRLLGLIDASQVALVSDSSLGARLRGRDVDYNPAATPDPSGLLERRAMVALTSGGNVPFGTLEGEGRSDFASQLLNVLRRVTSWHVGGMIFREVRKPLIQAGRPFVPQYGSASDGRHESRGDYIFERRELEQQVPARP